MSARRPDTGRGLAARLLLGQGLVLLAGALTAGVVAALIGPPIFHAHLVQAGHRLDAPELAHIEMAYRDASLLAVGTGVLISVVAAGIVTWVLTRRFRRPLEQVTAAARELARGHYSTRVPAVGVGTELETLASAFNSMAARLEGVEDTRRRMLADLAHELRTPIATLSAYHEGLHDGVAALGPDSRVALGEQTDRLARLADDIDDVSSAEEGRLGLRLEPHDVAALLRAAREAMRERYAECGVRLSVDLGGHAGTVSGLRVRADRARVGQVLANLLANALRHTPPGGLVTLAAHRRDGEVTLTVSDDGEGMTGEQLEHAFERFYRGDTARTREQGGSGIGLTISRAIVDAHGGSITAASAGPGRGSTFTVTLPGG